MSVPVADAIVVAAGASTRMGGLDKLGEPIGGRPLLAWTLDAIARSGTVARTILVTRPDRVEPMRAAGWLPAGVSVVPGGARRQESVAAGVTELVEAGTADDRVVIVHDAARPAVRPELVVAVVAAADRHGAAIPVQPVVETLKRLDGGRVVGTVDREGLAVAQTPQAARLGLLRAAFARFPADGAETWTDEAALLEACSIPVHAIAGHPDNVKVTVPADLERVRGILAPAAPRVGIGDDVHPFGARSPLAIGGIAVTGAPALAGHSDGDVALHAIADALLGAAALGDLGTIFPSDERTPRGIASTELLADVVTRLARSGLRPASVDVTLIAARPRLGPHLHAMRAAIADLLALPPDRVNVKASTGNLDGMEGAGRGISARAVAVVEPFP